MRQLVADGIVGRVTSTSVVFSGGIGGARVLKSRVHYTDAGFGMNLLNIVTGHILACVERTLGDLRDLSAVVTTLNDRVTIVETGQVITASAPDQIAIVGQFDSGAVASVTVHGGAPFAAENFSFCIVGTEGELVIGPAQPNEQQSMGLLRPRSDDRVDETPADYKYMNTAGWTITLVRPDGSVEDLAPTTGALTSGPPHVAAMYHELGQAIRANRPAAPDFNAAVGYHLLLETIQRAADSGIRQRVSGSS